MNNDGYLRRLRYGRNSMGVALPLMSLVFILLSIWHPFMFFQGCLNADWIQEAEAVSKQDAFNRCNPKDRKGSLPEGTVCRSAHCSRDKGNYSPRGICEYNGDLEGMYCSPIQPVVIWCAVSEVCGKVVENSQGTQAICKFDLN